MTLVLIAFELGKPISYFIPEMSFFANLSDIQNKEEALTLFRELEYEGGSGLAIQFMKLLSDINVEEQNNEFTEPDDE